MAKRLSKRAQEALERQEKRQKHAHACEKRFIRAHGPVPQDVWNQLVSDVSSWGGDDLGNVPKSYARRTRSGALYIQDPYFPGWRFSVAVDLEASDPSPCLHITLTGPLSGTTVCGAARGLPGHRYQHAPYSELETFLAQPDMCPACRQAWLEDS